MTAFVLRGFATEGVIDSPHLVATATFTEGKLTGTIRNDSEVRVTDGVVLAGDGYQLIPALAAGASAPFSFAPKVSNPQNGPPAILTIYPNPYNGYYNGPPPSQPTDADRLGFEKSAIPAVAAPAALRRFNPTITPRA